jgi:glycosyltransferase involved in cell wall biosynthesis
MSATESAGMLSAEGAAPQPTLSAVVVAHNEAAQLADCLSCLSFADEIVVLLDRCTDGSREIVGRFADRVIEGAWVRLPRRLDFRGRCRREGEPGAGR